MIYIVYMSINSLDYKLKNPFKNKDEVKRVHIMIEKMVERERPDLEDFRGIVDDKIIDRDTKKVFEYEQRWGGGTEDDHEAKRKADIAEYMIYKNMGGWMNQSAVTSMASKPDDYFHGIDLMIESESEDVGDQPEINHLGIGIDVALASERSVSVSVEKKTEKVREMIRTGSLTEARYVSCGNFVGSIKNLPYIILCVSSSHIEKLFPYVLRKDQSETEKNHLLKYIVGYQTMLQLGTYYGIMKKRGFEETAYELGVTNNFAVSLFGHLIDEMQQNPEIWNRVKQDAGTQEIIAFCEKLEKEWA